ncbi:ATP-dependent DNA ligase [Marisediminicola sp. LYQ134]|uniref:DUF7882 family protein n=1 Tax=unclassified Marisediminicola TaxID=2618316 RepID=UPI0039834C28
MGTFTYDTSVRVDFDDRVLIHLQLVISAKLRRDESFIFTWTKPAEAGGGRTSVWIDRRVPVAFDYLTSTMAPISRRWIDELTATTFNALGLQIVPDPGDVPAMADAPAREMAK